MRPGVTGGAGGSSGSRSAVISGAFPGNRASVPGNAGRGPEEPWNFPLRPGSGGDRGGAVHFDGEEREKQQRGPGNREKAFAPVPGPGVRLRRELDVLSRGESSALRRRCGGLEPVQASPTRPCPPAGSASYAS